MQTIENSLRVYFGMEKADWDYLIDAHDELVTDKFTVESLFGVDPYEPHLHSSEPDVLLETQYNAIKDAERHQDILDNLRFERAVYVHTV